MELKLTLSGKNEVLERYHVKYGFFLLAYCLASFYFSIWILPYKYRGA